MGKVETYDFKPVANDTWGGISPRWGYSKIGLLPGMAVTKTTRKVILDTDILGANQSNAICPGCGQNDDT